jgi:hypothetical protein
MTSPEHQIEVLIARLEADLFAARQWWELRRRAQAAEAVGNAALAAELDSQAQQVVWRASRLHRAASRLTSALDDVAADVEGDRQLHDQIEATEDAA